METTMKSYILQVNVCYSFSVFSLWLFDFFLDSCRRDELAFVFEQCSVRVHQAYFLFQTVISHFNLENIVGYVLPIDLASIWLNSVFRCYYLTEINSQYPNFQRSDVRFHNTVLGDVKVTVTDANCSLDLKVIEWNGYVKCSIECPNHDPGSYRKMECLHLDLAWIIYHDTPKKM